MRQAYQPSKLASFGSLLLVSGLLGVIAAFVVFPVFGGAGLVAKAAAASFENLPTDLKTPPLPQRSTILAADGSYLASFYSENRIQVTLDQVPEVTRKAVVAIEDSRFYEHNGIDVRGIVRAFVRNREAGATTQGASTLTQQYVKRVLLEQAVQANDAAAARAAVAKDKERKIREIRYALALEERLSKDQILERYLNIGYFGAGAYGIGTAAQVYFGKSVGKLTLAESAMLAGLLQSPSRYDPFVDKGVAALARRNVVLARMGELGFVPQADADKAEAEPIVLRRSTVPNGCVGSPYGNFCDYVRRFLLADPGMGATAEAREAKLFKGGLTVRTTLVPRLQKLATAAVLPTFPAGSRYVGGLAVVQPGTGRVFALALSRPFKADQNPYLTHRRFQTGSTAKAFVLTAALAKGMPLTLPIYAPHDYTSPVFYNERRSNPYQVQNDASGMVGTYDMRSAMAASVNTYYVQLEERVGVDNAVRMALAMGVSNPVEPSSGKPEFAPFIADPLGHGSFTLGSAGISPLDMANAYATLAAHGVRCQATPIDSVVDSAGAKLPVGGRHCQQSIDRAIADAATEALSWVVNPKGPVINGNTGGGAAIGRPVAGKTGTTQDIKEAWFVGYTPQMAAAAVVFDPLHQVTLPGGDRSNRISVNAWARFMEPALHGVAPIAFTKPDSKFLKNDSTRVPDVVGMSVEDATALLRRAGFSVRVSFRRVDVGSVAEGLVGDTSPGAGSRTAEGSTITLYLSTGRSAVIRPRTSAPPRVRSSPTAAPRPSPKPQPKPSKSPKPKRICVPVCR